MFSTNTTTKQLLINGSVDGQPDPNVTLSKFENGLELVVPIDHPRIILNFVDTKLTITVVDVQVKDGGMYRIRAANEVGGNYADFRIVVRGKGILHVLHLLPWTYSKIMHAVCHTYAILTIPCTSTCMLPR